MTQLTIQVVSDLHLEAQPSFSVSAAPTADVLILAGDIGSYQPRSQLPKDNRDFGLTRFTVHGGATGWSDVILVPGNHELGCCRFRGHRPKRECPNFCV